jgi:hypothetical protein
MPAGLLMGWLMAVLVGFDPATVSFILFFLL